MAVLKMTTQNLTTGRPSCIGEDGNEKGASPSTPRYHGARIFFCFEGMDGGGRQHGMCSKPAWCWQNALRFWVSLCRRHDGMR